MVNGNKQGIKEYILDELGKLEDIVTDKGVVAHPEIIDLIVKTTSKINREISVAINRKGKVIDISIGDSNTASLPNIGESKNRLCGIRIIHTHPNSTSRLSNVDISALITLRLDTMVAIGIEDGEVNGVSFGFCKFINEELSYETTVPLELDVALEYDLTQKFEQIEKEFRDNEIEEDNIEKAIIVGIDTDESLEELRELADACDIKVVEKVFQKKNQTDNAYFIGSGKVKELGLLKQVKNANLIIFDEELSGIQAKNLEDSLGCRVIDRTVLILEIFARRARTREAKIQVTLARLKYENSRLIGYGTMLSRQGGGGNTRGAGEQKLELDKRKIRETIHMLKAELEKIQKTKDIQRSQRNKSGIPKVSLVGYTNVGKSTLRNLLVDLYSDDNSVQKEHVLSQDMLFATLDTTVRTFQLPDKRVVSLTDTIGFIRKLPHHLVESFKSTLDEVIYSDLIIHVVDASSETAISQIVAVERVLGELKCMDKPMFLLLNKSDLATEKQLEDLKRIFKHYTSIEVSASKQTNIDLLLNTIIAFIPREEKELEMLIPYDKSTLVSSLYKNSQVLETEHLENGTKIKALVSDEIAEKYKEYIIK